MLARGPRQPLVFPHYLRGRRPLTVAADRKPRMRTCGCRSIRHRLRCPLLEQIVATPPFGLDELDELDRRRSLRSIATDPATAQNTELLQQEGEVDVEEEKEEKKKDPSAAAADAAPAPGKPSAASALPEAEFDAHLCDWPSATWRRCSAPPRQHAGRLGAPQTWLPAFGLRSRCAGVTSRREGTKASVASVAAFAAQPRPRKANPAPPCAVAKSGDSAPALRPVTEVIK
jgi:hypothetical protein